MKSMNLTDDEDDESAKNENKSTKNDNKSTKNESTKNNNENKSEDDDNGNKDGSNEDNKKDNEGGIQIGGKGGNKMEGTLSVPFYIIFAITNGSNTVPLNWFLPNSTR